MFSKDKNIQRLLESAHELSDVSSVSAVLAWDQEVYMPPKVDQPEPNKCPQWLRCSTTIFQSQNSKHQIKNIYDQALVRELKTYKPKLPKFPVNWSKTLAKRRVSPAKLAEGKTKEFYYLFQVWKKY